MEEFYFILCTGKTIKKIFFLILVKISRFLLINIYYVLFLLIIYSIKHFIIINKIYKYM